MQKCRKTWRAQARRPNLSSLASYLKREDVLLSAPVWRSTSCTVNLQRNFQHGKNISHKARICPAWQEHALNTFAGFPVWRHVTFKTDVPVKQSPVCSVLSSQPQQCGWTHHTAWTHFSSYFLTLLPPSQPNPFFLNKSAWFSTIQGVQRKSGVSAFLRNQHFLPARWLSFLIYTQSCHQGPVSVSDRLASGHSQLFHQHTEGRVLKHEISPNKAAIGKAVIYSKTDFHKSSKIKLWTNRAASASYLFHSSNRKIFWVTPRK